MSAQVIMLASGKGGTGKSTVSVLLGAALAARTNRVLLVELDSGLRSVDVIAGVCGKTVYDVEDVLCGRCEPGKAVVESSLYKDLYVISAPYSGGHISQPALRVLTDAMRPVFDFILIDTAAGIGAPFQAASGVCDEAVLVLTPDPVALRDGHIVADELFGCGCPRTRLIINRVPRTLAGTGIEDLDECIDTVGVQLLGVIPESAEVSRAAYSSERLEKNCLAARAFAAVAKRLCGSQEPLVIC